jgi:PAS domain S-box-containing protein
MDFLQSGNALFIKEHFMGTVKKLDKQNMLLEEKLKKSIGDLTKVSGSLKKEISGSRKTKSEIAGAEKLYHNLFGSNPLPMWIYDLKDLSFLEVNDAAIHKYGYSREEFLSMTIYDIRPLGEIPRLQKNISTKRNMLENSGDWKHRLKDGKIIYVEIVSHNISYEGRNAVLVIANDITRHKIAEESLRISEASLKEAQELAKVGSWELDMTTYKCVWTENCFILYGYKPFEVEPSFEFFRSRVHPDDLHLVDKTTELLLKGNKSMSFEHRIILPDGSIRWMYSCLVPVFNNHKIIKLKGINIDITERKISEEALRESEEKFSSAFEFASIGMALVSLDGRWLKVNRALCNLVGYTKEELLTKTFQEITHPDDLKADLAKVKKLIAGEINGYHMEKRYFHKSGTILWIQLSVSLVRDNDHNPLYFVSQIQDITERKRSEEEVKALNESLELKVRERTAELMDVNKELETFSYTVSHDLKSPLWALDMFSKTLLEHYGEKIDAEGKEYLGHIISSANQMSQLINDLLEFSKSGKFPVEKKKVNMDRLVRDIIEDIKHSRKDLKASIKIKKLAPSYCDAILIKQVWNNLISNAIVYSSKKRNPAIEIGMKKIKNEQVYYIKDNGAGFDMKYADKLFVVFQRMHDPEEFEGSGVGLATVHRIISKHGGRIWAEAKVNMGAVFYFTLNETKK